MPVHAATSCDAADQPAGYALVTGAGSGIGRAVCEQLAGLGWSVAATDFDTAAAEETASLVGRQALAVALDVSQPEDWRHAVERLQSDWPRLDLLVNNAGVLAGGELAGQDAAIIEQVVQTNLTGALLGAAAVLPWIIESIKERPPHRRGDPRPGVINISSIFALAAPPRFAAYNASKAGLLAVSDTLRLELAAHSLNATAVAPGVVRTGLFDRLLGADDELRAIVAREAAKSPQPPEEVASAAIAAAARGKRLVVVGSEARRVAWFFRWLPSVARWKVRADSLRRLTPVDNRETQGGRAMSDDAA